MELEVDGQKLCGSLMLPEGEGPHPLVLMHVGSGPTDRDGNSPLISGRNDSLSMLAKGLCEQGVASVRYDKRGIAASKAALGSEEGFVIDVLVDDLAAWFVQLRADARFSRVTLLGHSEGSLIAILVAAERGVDGLISVAGVGRPAGDILREQLRGKLPPDLLARAESFIGTLEAGEAIAEEIPAELQSLFRPSVHDYLRAWFAHDPALELAKVQARRVAIVQGTTDAQVTVKDAELLAEAHPEATLHVLEGMNHVLKRASAAPADQMRAYTDPSIPLHAELVPLVAAAAKAE
ncbi:MAG: lysophospholipase [Myxococcales bacterium]|nr:lysophospholipase [Myxococcales bacterium]